MTHEIMKICRIANRSFATHFSDLSVNCFEKKDLSEHDMLSCFKYLLFIVLNSLYFKMLSIKTYENLTVF